MQDNEFKFSRKKIWFDKQSEVLDKSLVKLTEIKANFGTLELLIKKEINDNDNFTIEDQAKKLEFFETLQSNNDYISAHIHYFPEEIEYNIDSIINSIGHLITKLDAETYQKDKSSNKEINKHMSNISSNIKNINNQIRDLFLD